MTAAKIPAFLRIYDISTRDKYRPFVFTIQTAHKRARVERIETINFGTQREPVMYVRDKGQIEYVANPETKLVEPIAAHEQHFVCVPLYGSSRETQLPEEAGDYLGSFSDERTRWHVFRFRPADDGETRPESPSPAPERASSRAPAAPQQRPPAAGTSTSPVRQGSAPERALRRNPWPKT